VVIVFALLAALCNAVSVTTRHLASVADPHRSAGWRLIIYLLRNPLWLLGWAAQAGAFVFQALALHNGEVSVVQPLLVIELVLTLVLRRVWLGEMDWIVGAGWATAALLVTTGFLVPWYVAWLLPPAALSSDKRLLAVAVILTGVGLTTL